MRTVVSLDPDFIPWEHEVVRLRRKKLPLPARLALLASLAVVVFGGLFLIVSGGVSLPIPGVSGSLPEVAEAVGSVRDPEPTALSNATGRPGRLTVQDGRTWSYWACDSYYLQVSGGDVYTGTTETGPVIDVTGSEILEVVCE